MSAERSCATSIDAFRDLGRKLANAIEYRERAEAVVGPLSVEPCRGGEDLGEDRVVEIARAAMRRCEGTRVIRERCAQEGLSLTTDQAFEAMCRAAEDSGFSFELKRL